MGRFVVLSFLFLAFGFYELSGGADFDPEATRAQVVEARQAREMARIAALPPDQRDTVMERLTDTAAATGSGTQLQDAVAPVALDLASFKAAAGDDAGRAATPLYTRGSAQDGLLDREKLDTPAAAERPDRVQNVIFPGRTLSSAFSSPRNAATEDAALVPRLGDADIRVVSGTLVNMRSGPGTDYEVIDQLEQATRVEVLTDNGDGWVELRALEGGATGWIAAFLLSRG